MHVHAFDDLVDGLPTGVFAVDDRSPVEVRGAPIRDASGTIDFAPAAVADITERRTTESYVRLLGACAVAANGSDTIRSALDRTVNHVCAHTRFGAGRAYLSSDVDGDRPGAVTNVGSADGDASAAGLVARVFATGTFASAREEAVGNAIAVPVLIEDEVIAVLEFFARDPVDDDDVVVSVLAQVAMHVSRVAERVRARDELQRALDTERAVIGRLTELNQVKDTLLRCLSHDIRNPLTVIVGTAKLVERCAHDPGRLAELVDMIVRNADRAAALTRDVLDVDRAERADLVILPASTDIAGLIRETVLNLDLDGRSVSIDAGEVTAEVDTALVGRIVENLVLNALRHTPFDTAIVVRAAAAHDTVTISVDDEGPGVSDTDKDRIFGLFQRGDTLAQGTGVGLSVVRGFAEAHGGTVRVLDRPGGGASFRVDLPLRCGDNDRQTV